MHKQKDCAKAGNDNTNTEGEKNGNSKDDTTYQLLLVKG